MAASHHVTNRLRAIYRRASKNDRYRILDEMVATTGMGRSTADDTPPMIPGVIETDIVAYRGASVWGEFARTLTMTDMVTRWTENASICNHVVHKHAFYWRYDTPKTPGSGSSTPAPYPEPNHRLRSDRRSFS